MGPTSSPYAIFRASDLNYVFDQPIAPKDYLRIRPKRIYVKKVFQQSKSANLSKHHVQLAFA